MSDDDGGWHHMRLVCGGDCSCSPMRCCGNVDKRCINAARERGRGASVPRSFSVTALASSREPRGAGGCVVDEIDAGVSQTSLCAAKGF